MALVFIAYPLIVYAALCLLPRAQAGLGLALAAAALALVWFTSGSSEEGEYARLLVGIGAVSVALAALAQGLRRLIPQGAAGWVWPALATGLALSAFAVLFMAL